MRRATYVLVWTIHRNDSGQVHGAFCPSGGLTMQEWERALDRLVSHAKEHGIDRAHVQARRVPYVFDVREAAMPA